MATSRAYALSGSNLIAFDLANPTVGTTIPILNLTGGETLVGIDFRPQNGMLYGLGVNAGAGTGTLYMISFRTGWATAIGTPGGIPLPAGNYGFDVNPVADLIRVVSDTGVNMRISPDTGGFIVDSSTPPPNTISGAAYTNNDPYETATTLYTLDATADRLDIQNPPNTGVQVPVGITGVDFTAVNGFDIPAGVNTGASGTGVASGTGMALLTVGGVTGLYNVNLATGATTFAGTFLNGTTPASGLAIQSDLGGIPAVALTAGGALIRFNSATPGTTTAPVAVTGLLAGEQLMGIDFRPQTGQLYGFGANAAANTYTVYIISPQTGVATIVGAPGQAFPGDLPAGGYGIDFNAAVDRLRITTDSGLNFRINPDNGLLAANDPAISGLPPGSTGVSGAAYTTSYGQSVLTSFNTLYTLDATSNSLFIQGFPNLSPNSGIEGGQLPVTLNGIPLDFTAVNGFDIPASLSVSAPNAAAAGFGYAVLTVAGVASLYKISLITGAATSLGAVGAGATALTGFTLADAPPAGLVPSDFNGDVSSDVLWQHTSGFMADWQINGGQITNNSGVATPIPTLRFQDTGDFNGNGRTDVLLRHDNGQVALWTMNGAQIVNSETLPAIGNDWRNQGVADFNADGKSDVLWRNDNGQVALWTMNGGQITDNQLAGSVSNAWHVQELADFNGDGKSDVLWRHDSGQVVIWTMNGGQIVANQSVANVGLDWNVAGTGDFDGDGRNDILWRHDSGQIALWVMDGVQIKSNTSVATPGLDWHVEQLGDYNHDGKSDVLLRTDSGQVVMWEMNGAQITNPHTVTYAGGIPAPISLEWTIQTHHYDVL